MPRPNPSGVSERKRRSRKGCWPCKSRKVKCGEEHPACNNCLKTGDVCDYSIRLNWEGRRTKRSFPRANGVGRSRQPVKQDQWFNTFANETPQSACSVTQLSSARAPREADSPQLASRSNERHLVREQLTIVDETPTNAGVFAKRLVDDLPGVGITRGSPRHAAQAVSPGLHARHNKTRSFTELNELDLGEARPSSSPCLAHIPASPALFDSPLTPAASSYSDDILWQPRWLENKPLGSPDSRLSVSSDVIDAHDLLSWYSLPGSLLGAETEHGDGGRRFHGYDLGKWDEDVGSNDDDNAISLVPAAGREPFNWIASSDDVSRMAHGHVNAGQESGYYDQAVSILIPWELEPLPDKLRNNKMNLLYFHHFIDHTAKVLVPYHEQESNPMSRTLPRMALQSDGLMSLILAYSAAHRAQAMQSSIPEMRMAQWAQAVFSTLREGLVDKQQPLSNITLTMSIMLVSLEIVSPGALGHGISWRQHLKQAGELMARRLEDLNMGRFDHGHDEECLFIRSWLANLNMLGTLSPAPRDDTAIRIHPLNMDVLIKDMDEVDCIMGFSARCARLLNHVAGMAKLCDRERIGPNHQVLSGWVPRPRTVELALSLEQQLLESMKQSSRPCMHVRMGNIQMRDLAEMAATNEAFHWAGIVHLHRRVLGKDSSHADVQGPVQRIVQCLEQTRIGGNAEAGLLFPMFTAGCETAEIAHRAKILAKIKSAETSGMAQVCQARQLMERVWESGCPWETMIKDEFIG